jgi:tetratricopeptide (TPR) repeat protein
MRQDRSMVGDLADGYLDGLTPERLEDLARVNGPGLTALREYLASGEAVAFLGAGVSAPLHPLWNGLIGDLVDAAAPRLTDRRWRPAGRWRGRARTLAERNADICREHGWNENMARCDRMLGRLARAAGDTTAAGEHLAAAAACFRDGDYLTELAVTLADLANCAQASGDLDAADRHATEAITIAAPRGLVPAQAAALAARARIRAAQAAAAADPGLLDQGRDAADAALRLATRHQLAWHQLDALRAHAVLDQAEGIDRGWAAKAGALHARLVPPDLDPDPLATVERFVAAQKAVGGEGGEG